MTLAHTLRSRRPRGDPRAPLPITDRDVIAARLEDAAHYPGGHAPALYLPRTEAEVAAVLRESGSALAIGAQSSLTGGATPLGDRLLATDRLNRILEIAADRVRVEAGVSLALLDTALRDLRGDVSLVIAGAIADALGGAVHLASSAQSGLVLALRLAGGPGGRATPS